MSFHSCCHRSLTTHPLTHISICSTLPALHLSCALVDSTSLNSSGFTGSPASLDYWLSSPLFSGAYFHLSRLYLLPTITADHSDISIMLHSPLRIMPDPMSQPVYDSHSVHVALTNLKVVTVPSTMLLPENIWEHVSLSSFFRWKMLSFCPFPQKQCARVRHGLCGGWVQRRLFFLCVCVSLEQKIHQSSIRSHHYLRSAWEMI